MPVCDRIPPFLTVEEASRLLKIGRTKAYLLTQEWRATGGRSGLAVVDLGDVLRVPGPAIEQMLGTGLANATPLTEHGADDRTSRRTPSVPVESRPMAPAEGHREDAEEAHPVEEPVADAVLSPAPPVTARTRRPRRRSPDQLPLFEPLPTPNPNPQTPTPSNPDPATNQ